MKLHTIVSRHISHYFVPEFIDCFFSFSFCLPDQKHSRTHSRTHTHISQSRRVTIWIHSVCFSEFVCVCGGGDVHIHVGTHTYMCALCYQLTFIMFQKSPCLLSIPEERKFSWQRDCEGRAALHLYPTVDSSDDNLKIISACCIMLSLNV